MNYATSISKGLFFVGASILGYKLGDKIANTILDREDSQKIDSEEILDNELKILSVKDDVAVLVNALDAQVESIENGKISIKSFNDSQVIIFRNGLKEIKELATSKKTCIIYSI